MKPNPIKLLLIVAITSLGGCLILDKVPEPYNYLSLAFTFIGGMLVYSQLPSKVNLEENQNA